MATTATAEPGLDPEAFLGLFFTTANKVHRRGDTLEADELVAEVWPRLIQLCRGYRQRGQSPRTYLITYGKQAMLAAMRKRRHRPWNSLPETEDGEPIAPPEHVSQLLHSIAQDLGSVPDEYLVAAGAGAYRETGTEEQDAADVWKGVYHEKGAFLYNEWDHKRRHYRKNWCVLRELDVHPGDMKFVGTTLARHSAQVAQLKRTFELLRGEDRLLKRQPHGDEIDLDAVATMEADAAHAALMTLHGVGPWTADIYLLFCLGHGDAWPAGDIAIQEAVRIGLGLQARPTAKQMPMP